MFARFADGIFPLGDGKASTRLRAFSQLAHGQLKPSAVGLPLHGVPTLMLRLFPLRAPNVFSETTVDSTPLLGFPHTWSLMSARFADEISPARRW